MPRDNQLFFLRKGLEFMKILDKIVNLLTERAKYRQQPAIWGGLSFPQLRSPMQELELRILKGLRQ